MADTTRSTQRRGIRAAVIAFTAAALVAGCGGSGADGAAGGGQGSSASVEDQLGFTRKGIAAAQAKVENSIAACMKSEGFDYVPGDPVAVQAALTGRPNMSDEEFEQQFGYGITTLYGRGSAQSDPNARIRASLGAAELRSYQRALSGGRPEQTFAFAADTGDFGELGGCTKQATEQAFGGNELLTTLQRKLDELDESIQADSRIVRANEAWTACMRDASGTTYADAEAIEDEIKTRFEAVIGQVLPPGQVVAEGSYDATALARLQRDELELSSKDLGCERAVITPVELQVRGAKEAVFRDQNAELLRTVKPLGS